MAWGFAIRSPATSARSNASSRRVAAWRPLGPVHASQRQQAHRSERSGSQHGRPGGWTGADPPMPLPRQAGQAAAPCRAIPGGPRHGGAASA
eukprot:13176375-Alexandrium_andersonii.AAC.1